MHDHRRDKTNTATSSGSTGVLAALRACLPSRRLQLGEALRIAEMQADRLRRLRHVTDIPVPAEIVTGLPRVMVGYDPDLPRHAASGCSDWDSRKRAWVIAINPEEPLTRQRFTVLHEFKHIIDHYHPGLTGGLPATVYGLPPMEYVAEYFAGCVLMPKRWVKAAFYDGIQRPAELAELFDVSARAIEVRLSQLRLTASSDESAPGIPRYRLQPQPRPQRYYRQFSLTWTPTTAQEVAA